MTTPALAISDSVIMLRRNLRYALRFPMLTVSGLLMPVLMLLLFDGVFGHTMQAGLGGPPEGSYVDFVLPGVLVVAAAGVAEATALAINADMGAGIIARFRTMAIWRPSVLIGPVSGSVIRTILTAAVVGAVGVGLGFAPKGTPLEWLAAAGLIALLGLALSWLTTAFGLLAKTPAGANSLSLIPLFLPFISSAFVPTASMPAGVRTFAQHQPFTPVINTLRGLLLNRPIGHNALEAVAWCTAIAAAGFWWSTRMYERHRAPSEG